MKNLTEMTNEELAMAYIGGDNAAFEIILQRTKDGVFSYILYLVQNEEIANDVFQDTYVKALVYLQRGKYEATGKVSSWLIRIAHNVVMDNYRRRTSHGMVENGLENDLSNIASDDMMGFSRETEYVNQQVMADVKRLMNYLPENQKQVVYMRFFQDLSFKEIAEDTGVSINTALGRMRYALKNMRKMARTNNVQLQVEGF